MAEVLEQTPPQAPNEADLAAALQRILAASAEPLTPSKIRSQLPASLRGIGPEQLAAALHRRVDANVLYEYSPYRSQQPRYWDRPLAVHVVSLVRASLEAGPLTWSQLRRKLPDYARSRAEEVVREQVQRGELHEHARAGSRTGTRYGLEAPDPREPLRQELVRLFDRLGRDWGFERARLRQAALELLHEEEWDAAPPAGETSPGPAPAPQQPPATVNPPLAEGEARASAPEGTPTPVPPAAGPAADRPPEMQP
jgi:hypothetical protein